MRCIFCEIIGGGREAHVIYEDASLVAFLDRYPIDEGHALVVPKDHHERITDMGPAQVGKMFAAIPRIAKAILAATGADAFSLAQNNGRAAKQIIPHVHVHIIPRFSGRAAVWTKRAIADDIALGRLASGVRSRLA